MNIFTELPAAQVAFLDFRRGLQDILRSLGVRYGPSATTGNFVFQESDTVDSLQVDATAGALTIFLPSTPTGQRRRRVVKTDVSANAVTVSAGGTILINGATTYALATQYKYVEVEPTGTKYLIINSG